MYKKLKKILKSVQEYQKDCGILKLSLALGRVSSKPSDLRCSWPSGGKQKQTCEPMKDGEATIGVTHSRFGRTELSGTPACSPTVRSTASSATAKTG